MKLYNNFLQLRMVSRLNTEMKPTSIQKGPEGSVYLPAGNQAATAWVMTGESNFNKFIKRFGLKTVDEAGVERAWTMASRGNEAKPGNVTMIAPLIKDTFGAWFLLQEEARPIDLFRNGKEARLLAFPAGIIGDEFVDETAMESAVRELTEETGLISDKIELLSKHRPIPTTPGLTDESTEYYFASIKKLKPITKALTDGVTKGWWLVPTKNLVSWLNKMGDIGKVATGQTLTALQLLIQNKKIKL